MNRKDQAKVPWEASPDDGSVKSPAFRSNPNDAPPDWPRHPFDALSKDHGYENWITVMTPNASGKQMRVNDPDPRERYYPTRQDVAAFLRWDIEFNQYGPDWRRWRLNLSRYCDVRDDSCESLDIPDIVTALDNTAIKDELDLQASVIRRLASRMSSAEQASTSAGLTPGQADSLRVEIRWVGILVADVLLKTHGLDPRLQHLGQFYPGVRQEKFYTYLREHLTQLSSSTIGEGRAAILGALAEAIQSRGPTNESGIWQSPIHLDAECKTARIEGITHALTDDQYKMLRKLIDARGGWVIKSDMFPEGSRPDRIRKAMPEPIQDLIESRTGIGYRLRGFPNTGITKP